MELEDTRSMIITVNLGTEEAATGRRVGCTARKYGHISGDGNPSLLIRYGHLELGLACPRVKKTRRFVHPYNQQFLYAPFLSYIFVFVACHKSSNSAWLQGCQKLQQIFESTT